MYKRLSAVLFPIAAILFVGAIVWGYQEHQEKNAILIKAENQYQRAFHDLAHHMNRLQDELGQTLAVSGSSYGMQRKGLVNVWRLTSQAQNDINQLPLAMLPFNKAEKFLAGISSFAYRTSVRDLTKQPLTSAEVNTLKSLYSKSGDINTDLGKIQDAVISDRLRWMDVEAAIASVNNPHDNTIIDGFKAVDKKIGGYPENDWGPSSMSTKRLRTESQLSGQPVSKEQVAMKARQFMGVHVASAGGLTVAEAGSNTELPVYSVNVKGGDGENIQMDFTRRGGHLLWYMNPRIIKRSELSFDTARNKATQFLVRHGYKEMTPVTYDRYDDVAVFSYVGLKDGVRIYPDKVTVRVALDNGEVVGLQASDHVFAPHTLMIGKPKVSKEQARSGLNPEFRVQNYTLAVIQNDVQQNVLCHEFLGKINGQRYRIYMNAETGLEETIEKIPESAKSAA